MSRDRLQRDFFIQSADNLARALLGTLLARKVNGTVKRGRIVETEAYLRAQDKAAHSYGNKKTDRTKAMFYRGGHVYVYFVYGMHWLFNISAGEGGNPEAVLIRALEPDEPETGTQTDGPAKLCRWLAIDGELYGADVAVSEYIWLEEGRRPEKNEVTTTSRIGVPYAEEWAETPLRFYITNNSCVSKI